MLLILYKGVDGALSTETNSMVYSQASMDAWSAGHPDARLLHVFDLDDDLNARNGVARDEFIARCHEYGLLPEAFGRRFTDPQNGHAMEVVGILPGNRKYTVRVMDLTVGRPMKCSAGYVMANLDL